MNVTLQPTDRMTNLNGVPARVWEGTTGKGVPIFCLITRVGVREDHDYSELEQELEEQRAPCSTEVANFIPLRMIL
jgi:hypothetical protein